MNNTYLIALSLHQFVKLTQVKPINNSDLPKKILVEQMFDGISKKYDFLNTFLSAGIDTVWRKKTVKSLGNISNKTILDVATGTADMAIQLCKNNAEKVIGIDISNGMLEIGKNKIKNKNLENKIELIQADSEKIPFENNKFDAVTVAFGVRNFENLKNGINEMKRVLKTDGSIAILEFSNPTIFPVKQMYNTYFKYILPIWGKLISKNKYAYTYLPESVKYFPDGTKFAEILKDCGYRNIVVKPLTLGICTLYTARK